MKKKIVITIVLIVLCIVGFSVGINIRNNHIKSVIERDVIYEGIYIEDIHIGGLGKAEATETLKKAMNKHNSEKQLKLLIDGITAYLLPYSYFEYEIDYSMLIDKAYQIGRKGTIKDRYKQIKAFEEIPFVITTEEIYNDEKINELLKTAKTEYDVLPKDAELSRVNNAFVIEAEVVGRELLTDNNVKVIKEALSAGLDEVKLEITQVNPNITKVLYEDIKDSLGSFYTEFSASQAARNENLRIASEKINGTILLPNDVFSTNDAIGPVDSSNGYQDAPIILNGKLQPGIGGGVCQIATTLYNSVLLAELEIVQRQNHSLPVGYIPKGRDATLAGDYIDFKFKNNTEYPIFIESYIKNNQLYMNIYGKEIRATNRTISFESEITDTIMPPPQKITLDASLKEGQEVVEKKSTIGYTVKLYKLIYIEGKLSEKLTINTSKYGATAAEIRRGSASIPVEVPNTEPAIQIDQEPLPVEEPINDTVEEDAMDNNPEDIDSNPEDIDGQTEIIP